MGSCIVGLPGMPLAAVKRTLRASWTLDDASLPPPLRRRAAPATATTAKPARTAGAGELRFAGMRMTDSLYLRLKSLNTRTVRGVTSPKNIVRVAAMHNLREIQAELGASTASGINPGRMHLNYQLRGPATADGVAALALALLDNAGVTKLRRDACMCVELVFSLPATTAIDHREYFAAAVTWADAYFNVPMLSAAVHLDEAAPHCHILLLPLIAGRMQGGALAGGPAKIRAMLADFQQQVAQRFGLTHQPRAKRLSKPNRDAAGRMVLEALRARPERLREPAMHDALIAGLGSQAEALLALLGLTMPTSKAKAKSFADIMTAPCKPERVRRAAPNTKHIDVAQNLGNGKGEKFHNVYLCVDVAPSPSPNPAHAQPLQPPTASRTDIVRLIEQRELGADASEQPAMGLQNSLHTPAGGDTHAGDHRPACTLLSIQAAPKQSTTGQIASTSATPSRRKRTAAIRQPVAAGGVHKISDTPQAVQQLDTLAADAAGKDASTFGVIPEGGAIPAPPAGASNFGHTPSKTGDTPTAAVDALETQQVDQPAVHVGAHQCSPVGGGHPGPRWGLASKVEDDYRRHRDDDNPADSWCPVLGEFVQATGPPARHPSASMTPKPARRNRELN